MSIRHSNLGVCLAVWTVFLIGLVVVGCRMVVPRQEWSEKKWGPLVPHTKFPADCSLCHLPERWDKLRGDFSFDHEKETGVPLEGAHAEAACLRCHNDLGPVEAYASRGCSGCHQDPHAASLGLECQQCHNETTWEPSGLVGQHARTRFPLFGAHAIAACESCHEGAPTGDFRGAPLQCEACHQDQLAQATDPDHIANGWVLECQRCHKPVSWTAGETFDHSFFPLKGVHGELSCTDCHTEGTFSGLDPDCYSCHGSDFETAPDHVALDFSHACNECHAPTGWSPATYDHSYFPLTGGHASLDCTQCHATDTFSGLSSDCNACHSDDFQTAPNHVAQSYPQRCDQCHSIVAWTPATFNHSTFPLSGGHAGLSCAQCHADGTYAQIASDCYSCHETDFQTAPDHVALGFSQNCVDCHSTMAWTPAAYDHSAFPLTGTHANLTCGQCHGGETFTGLSSDCYACHDTDYQAAPNHSAQAYPQACDQCHGTSGWTPATFDHSNFLLTAGHSGLTCAQCHTDGTYGVIPSDCYSCHDADFQGAPSHVELNFSHECTGCHSSTAWTPAAFDHTAFPLTGSHAALTCSQCHAPDTFTGLSSDCYSCHDTDYQGAPNHVAQAYPQTCDQCHGTLNWIPATFDHSSFPLTAGHSGLTCIQCHTDGTFTSLPTDCYSCHDTDYQGAADHVAQNFSHDCQQCHSRTAWTPATFDHSFFPLTDGHAGLACIQCHADGTYTGLTPDCYSCHDTDFQTAPSHVELAFSHICTECHTKVAWSPATYDHSFFPLTEGHAGLTCAQCHRDGTFTGATPDCYSCHDTDFQAAPSHVELAFSHVCTECHTKSAWTPSTYDHSVFPLTGTHATLTCVQCHGEGTFAGQSPDCYSCHDTDYQGAPNHLAQAYPQTCDQCHGTTSWTPSTFDHSSFPLTAGHSGLTCVRCHTDGTFTPMPTDCYSCHDSDFQTAPDHVALGYSHNCESCHTRTAWKPASFDHSSFPLTDGHAGLTCIQCHTDGTFSALPTDCYSCHDTDFQSAPSHMELNFTHSCEQCHTKVAWTPATYDHSFFPLTEGHSGLTCAQCHTDGTFTSANPDCYSCHDTDFQAAPSHVELAFSHVCTECHTKSAWTPSTYDHSIFSLTGTHATLICVQCHGEGTFTGLSPDCYSCHDTDYQGASDHVAQAYPHTCEQCHGTTGWTPSTFNHTSFPLTGGHAMPTCSQCHVGGNYTSLPSDCYSCHDTDYQGAPNHVAQSFPHGCDQCHSTTAWTPAAFDHSFFPLTEGHSGLACAQCHTDGTYTGLTPDCYSCHNTDFQSAPSHVELNFAHTCEDCHTKTAWTPATYDHSFFPLTDGHSGLTCAQCHTDGTFTSANPDCFSCHDTDFQGAPDHVAQNYSHDCDQCHSRTAWLPSTFDHSSFPLTEGHAGLACSQCHSGGTYTELTPDCYACHDTDFQAAPSHVELNFAHTCAQCHTKTAWTPATYDHSFFPLTQGHSGLLCAQCHTDGTFTSATPDCYSCHDTDYQGAPDHVTQNYSHDCDQCHSRVSWTPSTFDHSMFPLTEGHAGLTCSKCHSEGTYTGLTPDCYSCHDTDFQAAPSHVELNFSHLCEDCHVKTAWTPATYDHSFFPLTDGHSGLTCVQCHVDGTFTSATPDCYSCHDTVYQGAPDHVAQNYSHDCDQCHSRTAWLPSTFDHSSFPLTGGHAGLTCSQCHSGGTYTGLTPDCYSCHDTDFQSAPSHVELNFAHTCEDCHTKTAWTPSTYDHSFFPLTQGHSSLLCAQCHADGTFTSANPDCYSCHDTDYQGATDHVAQNYSHDCDQCHSRTAWLPSTFDHSSFPLTGGHAGLACSQCHAGGTYTGLSTDCYSCHDTDFQAAPSHVDLAFSHICTECHSPTAWTPANYDHSIFPLTGAHSALTCNQCHTDGTLTGATPDCFSCHDTDYQGAPDHVAQNYSHDCDQCHSRVAWLPSTFDHSMFPLTQGHAGVACAQCHVGGTYTGLTPDCYSCHQADFQAAPSHVDLNFSHLCEDCHTKTAWTPATFDHSFFPLTAGHSGLLCAQCHTDGTFTTATPNCYSCHDTDYQGAPNHVDLNFSHLCDDCHTRVAWLPSTFDHSLFPLTEGHSGLLCTQCHVGGTTTGLTPDCYSCHDTDYQGAPNHVAQNYSHNCEDCHTKTAWIPATFDHSFFPLTGAHSSLTCSQCHSGGTYTGLSQDCYSCHDADYQSAPNHADIGLPHTCQDCHSTTAWTPSSFTHAFPITNSRHGVACNICHNTGTTSTFSCLNGCHAKSTTDSHHSGRSGYVYESSACYSCHPRGSG